MRAVTKCVRFVLLMFVHIMICDVFVHWLTYWFAFSSCSKFGLRSVMISE